MTIHAHRAGPASSRGFSLVELIVVITIIALLLGIVLPVLPKIRDSARKAACASNIRQIGLALDVYKQTSKDVYPVARYMPPPLLSAWATTPGLPEAIKGQMEPSSPVYRCPGDRVVSSAEYADSAGVKKTCGMSYYYNILLAGVRWEETPMNTRFKLSPSEAPAMYDFDGGTFDLQSEGQSITAPFFHSTRNVLFVDNHVGQYDVSPRDSQREEPPAAPAGNPTK